MKTDLPENDASIAGQSAEHYVAMDDSLASLLLSHGIKVRDFILLSFLSDQGPMSVVRLSRAVGIDPKTALRSLRRLSSANLVLRDPAAKDDKYEAVARLTMRGEEIAQKIISQLE
jgi:DNA-binding MarR family transcriptional regulator